MEIGKNSIGTGENMEYIPEPVLDKEASGDPSGRKILDLLIELAYSAVVFLVPLYFSLVFPTYNVFELGKLAIFKILIWLLLSLTALKFFFFRSSWFTVIGRRGMPRLQAKKYFLVPAVFIIGIGLTVLFSSDPAVSFFGSYDRQAGYLSYLFYFLWFILAALNITTVDNRFSRRRAADSISARIDRLIAVAVFSSFLVSVYGILQILGLDFLSWPEDPFLTKRTISTFGQPNFLASWLLMVMPLSVYLAYRRKKLLARFFYILVFAAQVACFYLTSSRGGLVALVAAVLLFSLYLIFYIPAKTSRKFFAGAILAVSIIIGLSVFNHFSPRKLDSFFDLKNGSQAARLNFYQAAADAVGHKPVFGNGLENSSEIFFDYYLPDWGIYGDVASNTDRAHNLILDILITTGFFGLVFFLALYIFFFRLGLKNIGKNGKTPLVLALLFGAAAYLLSLFFSFTIVAGEVYFWLFLALLAVIDAMEGKDDRRRVRAENPRLLPLRAILILLILIAAVAGIYYEFRILVADNYFNRLFYTLGEGRYSAAFALSDYEAAVGTSPVNQKYYDLFLGEKLSEAYPNIDNDDERLAATARLLAVSSRLPGNDYESVYIKGKIASALGDYAAAREYFLQVLARSPYWPKTYIELGRLYAREGDVASSLAAYRLALSSLPDAADPRFNDLHRNVLNLYRKLIFRESGAVYSARKDYVAAEGSYRAAYASDISDFTLLKDIADTYYQRGDLASALALNRRGAERNPSDYNWYLAMALISSQSGDQGAARSYLDKAIELAPGEEWLSDLRASMAETGGINSVDKK